VVWLHWGSIRGCAVSLGKRACGTVLKHLKAASSRSAQGVLIGSVSNCTCQGVLHMAPEIGTAQGGTLAGVVWFNPSGLLSLHLTDLQYVLQPASKQPRTSRSCCMHTLTHPPVLNTWGLPPMHLPCTHPHPLFLTPHHCHLPPFLLFTHTPPSPSPPHPPGLVRPHRLLRLRAPPCHQRHSP
jgi:hypothetical protein